ncbi:hypothetical protein PR048_020232 [Dryococelus australis]|uniref:Uncharacterized protein n=1 Tax=Dryococelus australis TaxID=614101 RepID=A0ABQ9H5Q9_9NEOP|nr:hypothetical protein PR048_020232 [Dryococelus australis]
MQQMASCLHVNIKVPRITGTQRHRPNPPISTDLETYSRTTAYIPYIDDIISSITVQDLKDTYEYAFKGKWDLWKQKWNGIEEKPTCATDSLAKCDRHLFPNVYILLKILAVLPVSTASV